MHTHLKMICSSASLSFSNWSCSSMTRLIQAASATARSRLSDWRRWSSSSFSRRANKICLSVSLRENKTWRLTTIQRASSLCTSVLCTNHCWRRVCAQKDADCQLHCDLFTPALFISQKRLPNCLSVGTGGRHTHIHTKNKFLQHAVSMVYKS